MRVIYITPEQALETHRIKRFLRDMENISYHLAAGRIDKDLLRDVVHSILEGEEDFDEELKIRILCAIEDGEIGFDEQLTINNVQ